MSIKSVFESPLITENWKMFFCDKVEGVGPVLAVKQDRDNEFSIQFVFSYQNIRIDQTTSWTAKSTKDKKRDPDKEEEKRDEAFDKISQDYIEKFVGEIVNTFFKGLEEDKHD